jgi:hypothetical protein
MLSLAEIERVVLEVGGWRRELRELVVVRVLRVFCSFIVAAAAAAARARAQNVSKFT